MNPEEIKKGQILYCEDKNKASLFIPIKKVSKFGGKTIECFGISLIDYKINFVSFSPYQTIHSIGGFS